jgi:outer membrane protein TolC
MKNVRVTTSENSMLNINTKLLGKPARQAIFLIGLGLSPIVDAQLYQLENIVLRAQQVDPWLDSSRAREKAITATSVAESKLPDPTFSLTVANLPTDGFQLDQEPFTQFRIGVSQQLPRGKTLALRKQKQQFLADQHPIKREERRAQVRMYVSQIWLDAFYAAQSFKRVEQDRTLVEQFIEVVQASYASARGTTRQQDIVNAQLGLTRLDDKLTLLKGQLDANIAQLNEWIGAGPHTDIRPILREDLFSAVLPTQLVNMEAVTYLLNTANRQQLIDVLVQHPSTRVIDQSIKSSNSDVLLAQQKYKPQLGLNSSYATRQDEPNGRSRADFFSVGVSINVPLFNKTQQNKYVEASRFNLEATKTEKRVRVQSMLTQLPQLFEASSYLAQREQLYREQLIPQVQELAGTTLSAYTNDDGEFVQAIQAQINQLETHLTLFDIQTNKLKHQVQIAYLLTGDPQISLLNTLKEQQL